MITTLLHLLRLFPFLCGGHRQLALENLALRQQLAVYKRTAKRPKLRRGDRLFWVCLSRAWAGWRATLVIVAPDTVLRWQRRRFRLHWTTLSGRPTGGRPPVNREVRALVSRMAAANPLWGAPRIHGELLKLGIDVSERTVSRLIPKRRSPPSQTWRAFLSNHVRDLVSIDLFTVPTAGLRVLFVLVVLAHHRRRVLHFNVTEHPTAAWAAQQIVEAFPDDTASSYLLRDRDTTYRHAFRLLVKVMGIREGLTSHQATRDPSPHSTPPHSVAGPTPDCPASHPVQALLAFLGLSRERRPSSTESDEVLAKDNHRVRTHLSLEKDSPEPRPVEHPDQGGIVEMPMVGGLHHQYTRLAA